MADKYWTKLGELNTYSFFLIDGGVRRVLDKTGGWFERHKVGELVECADNEIVLLMQQRAELLEALKGMCALYNTDEGTRSLPQYVAAVQSISKAEAAE